MFACLFHGYLKVCVEGLGVSVFVVQSLFSPFVLSRFFVVLGRFMFFGYPPPTSLDRWPAPDATTRRKPRARAGGQPAAAAFVKEVVLGFLRKKKRYPQASLRKLFVGVCDSRVCGFFEGDPPSS